MDTLHKRVALVTGATEGIGFEIAKQLARKGHTVILGALNEDGGEQACEALRAEPLDVHHQVIDVTVPEAVRQALAYIEDEFGRLDILVNNAGVMLDRECVLSELDPQLLMDSLKVNLFGALHVTQAALPLMRTGGYGRIVMVASRLGTFAEMTDMNSPNDFINAPGYRVSKAALAALTMLFAKELQGTNILCNAGCPGWVRTAMGGPHAPLGAEEGADTPVWLATLPDGGPSGAYFAERQPVRW